MERDDDDHDNDHDDDGGDHPRGDHHHLMPQWSPHPGSTQAALCNKSPTEPHHAVRACRWQ
jgi:hypothetical protein